MNNGGGVNIPFYNSNYNLQLLPFFDFDFRLRLLYRKVRPFCIKICKSPIFHIENTYIDGL
jgi:hypothetical protein